MARIPDSTVEDVRASVDLIDVVGDYVRLKKQGSRFVGLCPFHNEKTPSFSVDGRQDLFYCFGCKRGGDLFKFVEEIEGVGFLDAVRLLADRAGIEIAEEGGSHPEADEREAMHAALRFAAKFFFDQLKSDSGKRGLDYLLGRGFSKETITTFGLGYAPDSWDALVKAAAEKQFKPAVLEKVGLIRARGSGEAYYDVFRDRVMFPILDRMGKVLGFSGRIVPGSTPMADGKEPAKYINTSDTPVYKKSEVLYGLKHSKMAIRGAEEVLLVEGNADVVSLYQAGIQNVVASSGTALSYKQVQMLSSLAKTIVLLFDADSAGVNAALKAVEIVLSGGLALYVVQLPDGADPDSFVQNFGVEAFRNLLKDERLDFVEFYVEQARRTGQLETGEGKGAVTEALMRAVARISNPVTQEHYIRRAAAELGVHDVNLRSQYLDASRSHRREEQKPPPRYQEPDASEQPPLPAAPPVVMRPEERSLLRLMFEHGAPMVEHIMIKMGIDEFSPGLVREVVGHIIERYQADTFDSDSFLRGDLGPTIQRLAAEVLSEAHTLSDNWELKKGIVVPVLDEHPFEAANSAMKFLKLDQVEEAIEDCGQRIFLAAEANEDLTLLNREKDQLTALRQQIDKGEFLEWDAETVQ